MTSYEKKYNVDDETTSLLSSEGRNKLEYSHECLVEPKQASKVRKGCVLAACFVLQLISNGIGYGLGVMYVEVMRVFNSTRSTSALIQSLFMAINTAGGILWAPVLAKYGSGKCSFVGSVTAAAGLFSTSFATSIYLVIILTGVLAGFGMCINYLTAFVAASLMFRENAGVPLVFLTTGSSIGQFIFPYMYEIFISQYGWSGAFIMLAGLSLQCVPASVIMYGSRDYLAQHNSNKKNTMNACAACNCDWALLLHGSMLLFLSNCLLLSATGNLESWFLVDLMTTRGFERQTGSLFASLMGLCNFFGRSTGVLLRHKVRLPTIYHWLYCMPILAVSHVLVIKFWSYWPLLVSCLLYGYVLGIVAAQMPAIMLEVAGLHRYADGMAFVNVFNGVGNLLGGTLGGTTKDNYGEYDPMFYAAVAVCIYVAMSSLLIVYIRRRREREDPEDTFSEYQNSTLEDEMCVADI